MSDSTMWDVRYREDGHAYGTAPSLYLVEKKELLKPGQCAALPADGSGRNAIWLAERGLKALSIDFSREAQDRARQLAAERGVKVAFELADVGEWAWPAESFDWVISIYCHHAEEDRARIHAAMFNSLKPGGYFLLEGFHADQLRYQSGGPRDRSKLLTEENLRADFADAEILEVRKDLVELNESRLHRGPGVLMRMLAKRRMAHGDSGGE